MFRDVRAISGLPALGGLELKSQVEHESKQQSGRMHSLYLEPWSTSLPELIHGGLSRFGPTLSRFRADVPLCRSGRLSRTPGHGDNFRALRSSVSCSPIKAPLKCCPGVSGRGVRALRTTLRTTFRTAPSYVYLEVRVQGPSSTLVFPVVLSGRGGRVRALMRPCVDVGCTSFGYAQSGLRLLSRNDPGGSTAEG
jgi:hypothetical protein